jgi:hypothetical protein
VRGDHREARPLARWLLFAATAIGLIAMHSLGHGGGPVYPTAHSPASVMAAPAPVPVDDCGGDGCTHAGGLPGHGGHQMPGLVVCQAVVEIFGLLLLMGLLSFAAAGHARPNPLAGHRCHVSTRAPPHPLIGLTLCSVSVLRI